MKLTLVLELIAYLIGGLMFAAGLSTWPHMHTELMLAGGAFYAPLIRRLGGPK